MINSISVYGPQLRNLPDLIQIMYRNREINITIISRKNSIFKILPCLYCFFVDGVILIQDREFRENDESGSRLNHEGSSNSNIDINDFISSLEEYIPYYIENELKKTVTKFDLVRLYLRINEIAKAEKLIPSIKDSYDAKMIDFLIKYKIRGSNNSCQDINNRSNIPYNLKKIGVYEYYELFEAKENLKYGEIYDLFIDICKNLDDNTKLVFACESFEIFPDDYFFSIDNLLNFNKNELKIFIRIKIADLLIRRKKNRIATLFLFMAAKLIEKECDILLKSNLIRMALKMIKEKSWWNIFDQVLREFVKDEVFCYGSPISTKYFSNNLLDHSPSKFYTLNKSKNFTVSFSGNQIESNRIKRKGNDSLSIECMMFLSNKTFTDDKDINPERFIIEPYESIYKYDIVKSKITDSFVNKIVIKSIRVMSERCRKERHKTNKHHEKITKLSMKKVSYRHLNDIKPISSTFNELYQQESCNVMGIIDSKNNFYQSYYISGRPERAIIEINDDIEISKIILDDGEEIEFQKVMKKMPIKNDIDLINITKNEKLKLDFEYKNRFECGFHIFIEHKIQKNKNGFSLEIDKDIKKLEISVEIMENIFLNREYFL